MRDIYISMKSFNQEDVERFGQGSFIDTIVGAGATGVGIQRELLRNEQDLQLVADKVALTNLKVAYAANISLWNEDGLLNEEKVVTILEEAKALRACMIKINLGNFQVESADWNRLAAVLPSDENVKVIVMDENQSKEESMNTLKLFTQLCENRHMNIQVGFDCGNWCYESDELEVAAEQLMNHVGLMHLKRIVKEGENYIVVPLNNAKEAKWKKVLAYNETCPTCIDFSLQTTEEGKYYVDLIKNYVNEFILA